MNSADEKPDLSKLKIARSESSATRTDRTAFSKLWIGVALGALLALLLLVRSCGSSDPQNIQLTQTQSAIVTNENIASVLNASGYVVAQRRAAVASKATGRLKELNVVEGDQVKQGQVLAVLENQDMVALVSEREANLNALRARIGFAQAEFDDAQLDLDRSKSLRQSKVVSQAELEKADARFKRAISDLESTKANMALAAAQLEKAKVDLGYTFITAPFDGTVLTKNADIGEIVAPMGSSSESRAAVVTIADMSSLEVEADVSEANITKVFIGQECEITLDSFPGKTYHGIVAKVVPTVDRAKATVLTKIRFTDRDEHVLPEMSAKIAFRLNVSPP